MKAALPIIGALFLAIHLLRPCPAATTSSSEEESSIIPLSADQYLVSPKDVLQITIVGEGDLPTVFEVGETDGTVKFPYIQYVKVSGLTIKWIEKLITALLQGADPVAMDKLMNELRRELRGGADPERIGTIQKRVDELLQQVEPNDCWYKNPQLNVMVTKYSEKVFYVEGKVSKPGMYSFTGENKMTVYRAIIRAGGFAPNAKRTVLLNRTDEKGNVTQIEVDVSDVIKKKARDPLIRADDVIHVPESFW